jgi:hypothetical protein
MRTSVKVCIIVAASLMLLGALAFGVALALGGLNVVKFGGVEYVEREYLIDYEFENISIKDKTAEIEILPSKDSKARVVCQESRGLGYTVSANAEDTLEIELVDSRKWYEHISLFSIGESGITLYLPEGEYGKLTVLSSTGDVDIPEKFSFESIDISLSTGDVECYASAKGLIKVKTSTGEIHVENVVASDLDLSVSTGKVSVVSAECSGNVTLKVSTGKANLAGVDCKSFSSTGDTGDLALKDVVAGELFRIERSTGKVSFENCDAAEIYVTTDTGDVRGSFLSDKVFIVETDTGNIDVPKSTTGGRCEIKTDTGDIEIVVRQ